MNKLQLDWSPIHPRLANQLKVLPFSILSKLLTLLGINWEIESQTIINFKKTILSFEVSKIRVVAPIEPLKGQ